VWQLAHLSVLNPRPSLRIWIEAKPHDNQFIILILSIGRELIQGNSCLTVHLFSVSCSQSQRLVSMARCKNVGGVPSDGDGSSTRLTEVAHGKRKKIAAKKRKRMLIEAELA
jgi:hypothetical protein